MSESKKKLSVNKPSERLLNYLIFKKKLKNVRTNHCIKNVEKNNQQKIGKSIQVFNKLGENSGNINSDVYNACHGSKTCEIKLVVKKIPMTENDLIYSKKPFSKESLMGSPALAELYFLRILNLLVEQDICNFLPLLYKFFICQKCVFTNKKVKENYFDIKGCLILVSDLADYTLKDILENEKNMPITHIISLYLQIFIAIYTMRKYLGIWHHDLHYNNILVYKVTPGGYWEYNIKGKKIKVPNFGYFIVITDFGYSRIPGIIEPTDMEWLHSRRDQRSPLEDYMRISSMLENTGELDKKNNRTGDIFHSILKYNLVDIGPSKTIIKIAKMIKNTVTGKLIKKFDTEKKLKLNGVKIFK
jgi:hypothetical protein